MAYMQTHWGEVTSDALRLLLTIALHALVIGLIESTRTYSSRSVAAGRQRHQRSGAAKAGDADYLNNAAPRYPTVSRRLREEGVVMLRVYVLPNGLPDAIELKRSSGSVRLDESALLAVLQWRFVPARAGTEAVAAWVIVPVAFSLSA